MMKRNIDLGLLTLRIAVGGLMLFQVVKLQKKYKLKSNLRKIITNFQFRTQIPHLVKPMLPAVSFRKRIQRRNLKQDKIYCFYNLNHIRFQFQHNI